MKPQNSNRLLCESTEINFQNEMVRCFDLVPSLYEAKESSLTFDRKKFQMVKVCIRANGFCSTIVHCKASPNIEFTGSIYIYPGVEMQNASEMPCPFTQHTVTLAKNRTRKRLIRRRAR